LAQFGPVQKGKTREPIAVDQGVASSQHRKKEANMPEAATPLIGAREERAALRELGLFGTELASQKILFRCS